MTGPFELNRWLAGCAEVPVLSRSIGCARAAGLTIASLKGRLKSHGMRHPFQKLLSAVHQLSISHRGDTLRAASFHLRGRYSKAVLVITVPGAIHSFPGCHVPARASSPGMAAYARCHIARRAVRKANPLSESWILVNPGPSNSQPCAGRRRRPVPRYPGCETESLTSSNSGRARRVPGEPSTSPCQSTGRDKQSPWSAVLSWMSSGAGVALQPMGIRRWKNPGGLLHT